MVATPSGFEFWIVFFNLTCAMLPNIPITAQVAERRAMLGNQAGWRITPPHRMVLLYHLACSVYCMARSKILIEIASVEEGAAFCVD